jgi:hypothetical protein
MLQGIGAWRSVTVSRNELRTKMMTRARELGLAEPVAQLIATAYEPRLDGVTHPAEFEDAVALAKRSLRSALADVTPTQGGRAETIALRVAKGLRADAVDAGATPAVALIDEALDRCRNGLDCVAEESPQYTLVEPERVLNKAGRPIGLWR